MLFLTPNQLYQSTGGNMHIHHLYY